MHNKIVVFLFSLTIFIFSCQNEKPTGVIESLQHQEKEQPIDPFVEGNKNIVRKEDEEIELFIQRYHWNMKPTGTGLRIEIVNEGNGDFFKEGDKISLAYKLFLLDGTVVYDSNNDGKKSFVIDKSPEIAGLHEAVKYLKRGGKANLVIPSHLAYGVAGDGNKIYGRKSIAMIINIDK